MGQSFLVISKPSSLESQQGTHRLETKASSIVAIKHKTNKIKIKVSLFSRLLD